MLKKKVTVKIIALLILSDVLETLIHFFFKKTALSTDGFNVSGMLASFAFLKAALFSPFLWVGLLLVLLVFIIWSTILSKIDLSVAVPIASFSYIFVPLVSVIFLHEQISIIRWLGILLILIGVIFVSLSSKECEVKA